MHNPHVVRAKSNRTAMAGIVAALGWIVAQPLSAAEPASARPSLQEATAQLKVPPDWFDSVTIHWDMNKPWKDARLEVRRLLALDEAANREAVKITWLYSQKGDIGDGHELPMYLFMSGNYVWALQEYPRHLLKSAGKGPTHEYMCFASCYAHFGEFARAMEIVDRAAKDLPPDPWRIRSRATVEDMRGDIYAMMGDIDKAKTAYGEAMRILPTSTQPYGRQTLQREVAKIRRKVDLLTFTAWDKAALRDGTYSARIFAYAEDKEMVVMVTIRAGKIVDIKLRHWEKIELNATKIIPRRIIEKQSLKVDVISGATVTSQAIINGTYEALKQAGLK